MSNPTWTRKASRVISLIRESGSWSGTGSDPHPPFGNEEGSTRLARIESRFSEPDWPATGTMVRATLTVHESGTSAHPGYDGSSPRVSVRRINETPDGERPSSTAGDPKVFSVNGPESHTVTDQVEDMLPSRIKRRDGTPCGNRPYGWFQFRSEDEDNDNYSGILTDDMTLTVELKTVDTPSAPLVVEVIGAQADTSGPTVVGSTDGRTLDVRFAFRTSTAGDYPSKVKLTLYGVGATDDDLTPVIKTTGNVTPEPGGGAGIYRVRMTGIPLGTEGRFGIVTTSHKSGEAGDQSSLDDDAAWVRLATIPGPPLDVVFQPFASGPHILGTLNSPDPTDYITGAEAEVQYLPEATIALATGMQEIGGTTRRSDQDTGLDLAPGQTVTYRLRHRNRDQVVGLWSAWTSQTVREEQTPSLSPDPGRLTDREPTITLTFPTADGARLRLLDPLDHDKVIYDTGVTPLVNQTSHAFTVPAGKLAWGQAFDAVGSYVPDGAGTTYTAESEPIRYTIARLAVTTLSVPDAVAGKVNTTAPEWLRTVTDPDGAAIASIEQEVRIAANPQGSGTLVVDDVDVTATPLYVVPGGTITYETSVDSRARAVNDTGEAGPWSPWLTITAMEPPDVDLVTPADGATINDPTQALDWSTTGHGGRTQASAVVSIYDSLGTVLATVDVGPVSAARIPAFVLDDATDYGWSVEVTDTEGITGESEVRTFTTSFAEPIPVDAVSAIPSPTDSAVDISWGLGLEPYLYNIEVTWIADDGSPVRIDGGPESLLDGNTPFTGGSIRHIGARLGVNTYHVALSNGWRSSDPVSASATLTVADPAFPWQAVDETDEVAALPVTSGSMSLGAVIERFMPPGGSPRQLTWGEDAETWALTMEGLTGDPELLTLLRSWMAAGTPVWVKAPAGFRPDPMWGAVQRIGASPQAYGVEGYDIDIAQVGDPVHAILPPVVTPPEEEEGNIYVTEDTLDFGTFVET